MKKNLIVSILLFFCTTSIYASNLDCAAVVEKSAHDWVNQQAGSTLAITQAVASYGNCVDQRLKQMYQHMIKTNNYPLMGVNGNFQDFEAALNTFNKLAAKASATGGTIDAVNYSYMQLYAKTFNLLFYAPYLKGVKYPLIERIKNTKRPDLATSQKYYNKMMKSYPAAQREPLEKAFNQLLKIGVEENQFNPNYIYDYAISILQSLADKEFSPSLF